MIISPPCLDHPQGDQSDHDWLNAIMPNTAVGAYPITSHFDWHGGQHILGISGQINKVYAIADGVIVYYTPPSSDEDRLTFPGNIRDDNGCVVIRHETEIGEGYDGKVVFFSVYQHLHHLSMAVKGTPYPGQWIPKRVSRKEYIGDMGVVGGEVGLHFEIICSESNLKKIMGRTQGELDLSKEGRTNIVYGDNHFYLPSGTDFYATQPTAAPLPASYTSSADLFISLHFDKGQASLSTYQEKEGQYSTLGEPLQAEADYEYNLYKKATDAAKTYPIAASALYELYRFGRVINTANESPIPPTVPHWHQVNYPGGQGWVNLNAANVKKYSDADFPHWLGWTFINDDPSDNGLCDSPTLQSWFLPEGKEKNKANLVMGLKVPENQQRLAKTICQFPSEWDGGQIDTRYGWWKTKGPMNPEENVFSEEHYAKLKTKLELLCFWEKAVLKNNTAFSLHDNDPNRAQWDTELEQDKLWHFHPREFIEQMRKCGWLGVRECKQLVPTTIIRGQHSGLSGPFYQERVSESGGSLLAKHLNFLNQAWRKYGINTPVRLAAFVGNSTQETTW